MEYQYQRESKDNKFSFQGYDLALAFGGPGVEVDGKAIRTWQALSKPEHSELDDKSKIVDWAMLNANFTMELPKCTKETLMTYGEPIEGELTFLNIK